MSISSKNTHNYNFTEVENKWRDIWSKENYFQSQNLDNKYYVLEMFPYPSGNLHMGHVLNYTIGDAVARYKRMEGCNVIRPMGWDAFGLPAENAAIERGVHPSKWTYENIDKMKLQFKKLGLMIDWSREIATCHHEYYKHEQRFFIDFIKNDLAYQKESMVNWDPVDKTVLANEQVVDGKGWRSGATVEKKLLKQWFLRISQYSQDLLDGIDNLQWPDRIKSMQEKWIGKSNGAEVNFSFYNPNTKTFYFREIKQSDLSELSKGLGKILEFRPKDENYQKTIDRYIAHQEQYGFSRWAVCDNGGKIIGVAGPSICRFNENDIEICFSLFERENFDKYAAEILQNLANWVKLYLNKDAIFLAKEENIGIIRLIEKSLKFSKSKKYGRICYILNADYSSEVIDIFTTRPETLFGGSFVAISPNHPLALNLAKANIEIASFIEKCNSGSVSEADIETQEKLGINTGLYVLNPVYKIEGKNIKLPIWIANFVLTDYGTGAIFGCPAHDERDFEFAKKYALDIKTVIDEKDNLINSSFLDGLNISDAKIKIINELEKNSLGKAKTTYRLKDWGVSRQRYWGCPIPVVYCDKCGVVPEKYENLPIKLPEDVIFDGKGNPLENHPIWKHCKCPKCGGEAVRETDTLDTFFESSWYFARFCDPRNNEPFDKNIVNRLLPVDQYIGGAEHAVMHLLYARFFTRALKKCGYLDIDEPFTRLLNQGMVLHATYKDCDGNWVYPSEVIKDGERFYHETTNKIITKGDVTKMSKSKRNVIDPDEMIELYGADAIRMFMLSDSPVDRDLEWSSNGAESCLKYINRLYKLYYKITSLSNTTQFQNDDILIKMHTTIKACLNEFKVFGFNKIIAKIRELHNVLDEIADKPEYKNISVEVLKNILLILHPIIPHVTSELLNLMQVNDIKMPQYDEKYTLQKNAIITIQINGKSRLHLEMPIDSNKEDMIKIALSHDGVRKYLANNSIKNTIAVQNKIINFVI